METMDGGAPYGTSRSSAPRGARAGVGARTGDAGLSRRALPATIAIVSADTPARASTAAMSSSAAAPPGAAGKP